MSAIASTAKLNYADKPHSTGKGNRSYRITQNPTSGQTTQCSGITVIDLPSNQANSYLDFTSSVLQFKMTPAAAQVLDKAGAYGLIRKLELLSGSTPIANIDYYNVLVSKMLSLDTDDNYCNNVGSVMAGLTDANSAGPTVPITGATFSLPLIMTPLFDKKYWPLFSRDSLRIRITWETANYAVVNAAAVADSDVAISDVNFIGYVIELSDESQSAVMSACGGVIEIFGNNYENQNTTLASGATAMSEALSFQYGSLNRVMTVFQPTAGLTNAANAVMNSGARGLQSFYYRVGGIQYPQRAVEESGEGDQVMYEMLVSHHALGTAHSGFLDEGAGFYVDAPSGAAAATTGHYFTMLNLESQHSGDKGLYSGINSVGKPVSYHGSFSNVASECLVHFFSDFTQKMVLDPQTQTFMVYREW